MHDLLNTLLIAAVVVWVLVRRFTPRRIDGRNRLLFPGVLAVIGLVQGSTIDSGHAALSTALLVGEVVVVLLLGALLGATMHLWRKADGSTWCRATWATFGVFLLSVAVRGGIMAAGYAAGVRPGSGAIMITVAAWLLAQRVVIDGRARMLPAPVGASVQS